MVNVFSIIATSDTSNVNSAFVETKDALESIFGVLSNTGYQNIGPSEQEVEDAHDILDKWDGCFSFDNLPTTPEDLITGEFKSKLNLDIDVENAFKGKGLKWAREHAENFGEVVVKTIAETIDPNIMFTRRLTGTINKIVRSTAGILCKEAPCLRDWMVSLSLFSPFWPFPPSFVIPFSPGNNFLMPITPFGVYYLYKYPNCPAEETKLYSKKLLECDLDATDTCVEKPSTPNIISSPIPDAEE